MDMMDWAKREVEIACARERKADKSGYGIMCYTSALKAYELLLEDGHSGMSWGITKQILMRLMENKPLTPIEDTPDIWEKYHYSLKGFYRISQCKRMPSLFKEVHPDGSIEYTDNQRVRVHDTVSDTYWHSWRAERIVNEMFPITMPYVPEEKPYIIEVGEYLTDRKNGDFDTVVYKEIIRPDGEMVPVKRYFADSEHGMKEITYDEFMKRYEMHREREKREEQECR